jgi:hypothetical protein
MGAQTRITRAIWTRLDFRHFRRSILDSMDSSGWTRNRCTFRLGWGNDSAAPRGAKRRTRDRRPVTRATALTRTCRDNGQQAILYLVCQVLLNPGKSSTTLEVVPLGCGALTWVWCVSTVDVSTVKIPFRLAPKPWYVMPSVLKDA